MYTPGKQADPRTRAGSPPSVPLWLRAVVYSQVLFWGAWWIGYLWLPEGMLRGKSGAAVLPIDHLPPVPRILAVVAWNLSFILFIVAANLIQVRQWPLGLTPVLLTLTLYGLLLGTNSLAVELPERLRPSLPVVFQRSGFLEFSAYMVAALATASIGRWRQKNWWFGRVERITPTPLTPRHHLLLALAILLVVAGAVREVIQWCGAAGC